MEKKPQRNAGKINTPINKNISLFWLGTCISTKCGAMTLVLWAQTSLIISKIMRSCKYFPPVSKIPTLTYN